MQKLRNIIVLGGGDSSEREVSLRSSKAVFDSLKRQGFSVILEDPRVSEAYLNADTVDMVFPILHGKNGEDGVLQAKLEEYHIPFLGSGSQSSKNSFDKWKTRQMLQQQNVLMAIADFVSYDEYITHELSSKPHVIKRVDGGSSIGTFVIRDIGNYDPASMKNEFGDDKLLLEQLIEGDEITVSILDEEALPVIEIKPPEAGEFDYINKYNGTTQEICPPQSVSLTLQKQAQAIAKNVHSIMQCRHLSRVDIMIDQNDNVYVLEINTIPGMTNQSLFPKAAAESGLNMDKLVYRFVELVAREYGLEL